MKNQNCWEYKDCGRGPHGSNDCPAAKDKALHGVHGGLNAGRACWVVTGTSCESGTSGVFARQLGNCWKCDFFKLVLIDEQKSETGFSATKLGMLRSLQIRKPAQGVATDPRLAIGDIDKQLRDEFVKEVNKLTSGEDDPGSDLKDEFAKEVERLSSKSEIDSAHEGTIHGSLKAASLKILGEEKAREVIKRIDETPQNPNDLMTAVEQIRVFVYLTIDQKKAFILGDTLKHIVSRHAFS